MKKILALLILLAAAFQLQAQTTVDTVNSKFPPASDTAYWLHSGADHVELSYNRDSTEVLAFAEKYASFPGGNAAFFKFLMDSIPYPAYEKENSIQGTVYVSFVVEKDGSITNVRAVREVPGGPGLSKEAVRVISIMPKWSPGTMNGRPVRIEVTQPVKFVLSGGKIKKKKKH